jgi:hypothetical protein
MSDKKQSSVKLYTEKEIRKFLNSPIQEELTVDEFISKLTPIELPTDEEIFKQSIKEMEEWYGSDCKEEIDSHFRGAKWMRDKIGGQDE